jgi:hypothetical protein
VASELTLYGFPPAVILVRVLLVSDATNVTEVTGVRSAIESDAPAIIINGDNKYFIGFSSFIECVSSAVELGIVCLMFIARIVKHTGGYQTILGPFDERSILRAVLRTNLG